MVNLGSGFLFMDNPCGEVILGSDVLMGIPTNAEIERRIAEMPPKHQAITSYKCCGCSRFFGSKDWPRCPHCGAETGAY
jgi:hypothetical protein